MTTIFPAAVIVRTVELSGLIDTKKHLCLKSKRPRETIKRCVLIINQISKTPASGWGQPYLRCRSRAFLPVGTQRPFHRICILRQHRNTSGRDLPEWILLCQGQRHDNHRRRCSLFNIPSRDLHGPTQRVGQHLDRTAQPLGKYKLRRSLAIRCRLQVYLRSLSSRMARAPPQGVGRGELRADRSTLAVLSQSKQRLHLSHERTIRRRRLSKQHHKQLRMVQRPNSTGGRSSANPKQRHISTKSGKYILRAARKVRQRIRGAGIYKLSR